jgi:hypothetical protein
MGFQAKMYLLLNYDEHKRTPALRLDAVIAGGVDPLLPYADQEFFVTDPDSGHNWGSVGGMAMFSIHIGTHYVSCFEMRLSAFQCYIQLLNSK